MAHAEYQAYGNVLMMLQYDHYLKGLEELYLERMKTVTRLEREYLEKTIKIHTEYLEDHPESCSIAEILSVYISIKDAFEDPAYMRNFLGKKYRDK